MSLSFIGCVIQLDKLSLATMNTTQKPKRRNFVVNSNAMSCYATIISIRRRRNAMQCRAIVHTLPPTCANINCRAQSISIKLCKINRGLCENAAGLVNGQWAQIPSHCATSIAGSASMHLKEDHPRECSGPGQWACLLCRPPKVKCGGKPVVWRVCLEPKCGHA